MNQAISNEAQQELAVIHLLQIVDELVQVLDAEPALLTKREDTAHQELLRRKQRLTTDYNADLKALAQNPETVTKMSPTIKDRLRKANEVLEAAVQRNVTALKIALSATERLVHSIITAVREETTPKQNYKNPQAQLAGATYKTSTKPVACNRTV